ncbi:MAG: glycoside hydrolase family 130 protein [Melioribacteraceae bacterium]|nr:glycoside hydrolase family 130 protein [Melioribacteraceae bacterium]MCF8353260.1 glycoside hydrolase family 130 protein [Melioribacteraceae bacterium]MCF8395574.1 glycoside hydrolase family 130 protein [Melioribacteraceae bacterium]MCF8418787.1 glycoside hydrolase family 130 protein [Melioribacteraceae bacterium]
MRAEKLNLFLRPDPKKVVLLFFKMNKGRSIRILERIQSLSETEVEKSVEKIFDEFSLRHKNFEAKLQLHYKKVKKYIRSTESLSERKKMLIGAYFSKEYSIESAALFNPSIVPHPDQSGTAKGELKFVMSLRATGEGHVSSIEFREGIVSAEGDVKFINESIYKTLADKKVYSMKKLKNKKSAVSNLSKNELNKIRKANYTCSFEDDSVISERVLFPNSKAELMGLEDARFVKFVNNGDVKYYATYTAYNGKTFRTQIIETNDFKNFDIGTLHGKMIKDKGMAIFPRKVNGKYFITSRQDGENIYIMKSEDLFRWKKAETLLTPSRWWGFIQIGNCGSPIETEKGWVLFTHEVGPLRNYVISAILLDLENPYKIIGKLNEPLIEPSDDEREGYVPNVVYSCGSLLHNNNFIIPYAMSDSACGFARIDKNKLLNKFSEI